MGVRERGGWNRIRYPVGSLFRWECASGLVRGGWSGENRRGGVVPDVKEAMIGHV